jgi:hypothetical protein
VGDGDDEQQFVGFERGGPAPDQTGLGTWGDATRRTDLVTATGTEDLV